MIAAASAVSPSRIRATPYARRLARERGLPLSAIAGSGPNGRITGDDLKNYRPREASPASVVQEKAAASAAPTTAIPTSVISPTPGAVGQTASSVAAGAAPAAIVTRVEFAALDHLHGQIRALRPGVSREDICLKAAAIAQEATIATGDNGGILLLTSPDRRQHLAGLAHAAVGAIAALREKAGDAGAASLAVSFIGRRGVRPVAAQLVDGVAARLVIGAAEKDGSADCLLSYDPARITDAAAEEFLVTFRELVETPFRLLV